MQISARIVRRLARLRVPLGFIVGVAAIWLARPECTALAFGTAIAAAGEALRVWAAGHLIKSTEVTRSGPYHWFAHPLYIGSATMGLGFIVAARSAMVTVLVGTYLAATLAAAIRSEELFLREKFGEGYDAYRHGRTADNPSRRFSLARALENREQRAIAGMLLVIALLWLKSECGRG